MKYTYYDNGDVKTIKKYYKKNDTTSYILYVFYKGNVLAQSIEIKNNKLDGIYKSYRENGKLLEKIHYKNDLKYGVAEGYNDEGELNRINLFINDTTRLQYDYYYNEKLKYEMLKYIYLDYETKKKQTIGKIIKNSDGIIIDSLTTLPVIKAKDTITIDKKYCFELRFPKRPSDSINFKLYIGKLDAKLNLKDTLFIVPFNKNYKINFCFKPQKIGYNLFTGIISYDDKRVDQNTDVRKSYIPIFKDYYVIEKDNK